MKTKLISLFVLSTLALCVYAESPQLYGGPTIYAHKYVFENISTNVDIQELTFTWYIRNPNGSLSSYNDTFSLANGETNEVRLGTAFYRTMEYATITVIDSHGHTYVFDYDDPVNVFIADNWCVLYKNVTYGNKTTHYKLAIEEAGE